MRGADFKLVFRALTENHSASRSRLNPRNSAGILPHTASLVPIAFHTQIRDSLGTDRQGDDGGIEAWLKLGEAAGLSRDELLDERHIQPGVRFAVDAYVNFARTKPWPIAVASSLTELFAPDLMAARLAAFEKHYTWVEPWGFDYFRRRLAQAKVDSGEGLELTMTYCTTRAMQEEAVHALSFKCDMLWSMLDAIQLRYGK